MHKKAHGKTGLFRRLSAEQQSCVNTDKRLLKWVMKQLFRRSGLVTNKASGEGFDTEISISVVTQS